MKTLLFSKHELQMIEVSLYVFSQQKEMHESKQTKVNLENLLEKVASLRRYLNDQTMIVNLSKKEIKLLLSKLLSASDDNVSHLYDKFFSIYEEVKTK